jgi:hypothetical protein
MGLTFQQKILVCQNRKTRKKTLKKSAVAKGGEEENLHQNWDLFQQRFTTIKCVEDSKKKILLCHKTTI